MIRLLPRFVVLTCILLGADRGADVRAAEIPRRDPSLTVASYYFGNYHPGDPRNELNSPRCDQRDVFDHSGYPFMNTISGNTPERFRTALQMTKDRLLSQKTGPRMLNINCWNEWTEGSYLEPDTVHGMKYLEAVHEVFGDSRKKVQSAKE